MKNLLATAIMFMALGHVCGQSSKMLLKSWIVTGIYLPDSSKSPDTNYLRYTFDKNTCYICFNPGWNTMAQDWSRHEDLLTIGIVNYHIGQLTDTTLTLTALGFRTIMLKDENCLNRDSVDLQVTGTLNGDPIYAANHYITPRYKNGDFEKYISGKSKEVSIVKESTFLASFVVHKDGTVSDTKVEHSVYEDFDNLVVKAINSTSKDWSPALFKGSPVNTRMTFTIHFLDSPSGASFQKIQ